MKKILLLAPFDLFPPVHGGSRVVYSFIKYASKRHKIHALITHLHSQGGKVDLINENIKISYCKKSFFDKLKVFSILFNVFYFRKAYLIMKEFDADIIQCELMWPAFVGIFLKWKFNKPLILVEYNVEYLKFKTIGKFGYYLLGYLLKKIEKIACKTADKIITLSEIDKEQLINLYHLNEDKIKTIIPCVNIEEVEYKNSESKTIRKRYQIEDKDVILTFVGNLKYIPNIIGVKYIAQIISPAIIDKYPNSKILIIGQGQDSVLKYKRENIIFTGYLDMESYIKYLSCSDIVIVPIDRGSGIRIKILEIASCAKPIVATYKAVAGLNFINQEEILLTEKVDEKFIEAIFKLIEDEELRKKIGQKAKEKVIKEYNLNKLLKEFEDVYKQIEEMKR